MGYAVAFVAGIAALYLYERSVVRLARYFIDTEKSTEKALRKQLFAKISYDGLLRVEAALDAELAKRRAPTDG